MDGMKSRKIEINNIADKKISIALLSSFVVLTIQYFILTYFNLMETNLGTMIQFLSQTLVGVAYLFALPSVFKRSKIVFITVYFFSAFIFLLNFAIFPENRIYMIELIFPFFFMCLPSFVYMISIKNTVLFKEMMKKTGYIIFIVGLLTSVIIFTGNVTDFNYSMSLAYYMLLPLILFLDSFLNDFSIKHLIGAIFSLLIIFSLGSRGPILCVIVFIFLKILRPNSRRSYKRVFVNLGLITSLIIILMNINNIVWTLYNLLAKYGIRSRTLQLFIEDGIYLSGRNNIFNNIIIEVFNNPILGVGIAGDRRIIGGYAHNLFIEIIANFGIIFGIIVCVSLIAFIIKSLTTKDKFKYNLIIIWLSLGFVPLMVSSSYLIDIEFWIFIGLLVNFMNSYRLY